MEEIKSWLDSFYSENGMSETFIPYFSYFSLLIITVIFVVLGVYITRIVLNNTIGRGAKKTKSKWDNLLVKHKFLNALSLVIAVVVLKAANPLLFGFSLKTLSLVDKMLDVFVVIVVYQIIISVLKATEESLANTSVYDAKPLASYFQLMRIILMIIGFILSLSILVSKSPMYLLTAFGALSAVLLLIFKDTILGLVASVQISANDMVRVKDWVEMSKYGADGEVISINLNTVKIKNWDNTITTIPTYYFVTEGFKNYRGMQDSGGRRIKRTLRLSVNSVRFVDKELREELLKIHLIHDYITERQIEIEEHNTKFDINTKVAINGRRLTNIGIFRIYIQKYLENHPGVRKDMSLLARLKEPDEKGVPIEIYCFANATSLKEYEPIQSDIFDHLFAAATYFGLEIFQNPSGKDFRAAIVE